MKKLSIKKQTITHTKLFGVFDTVDNNIVMLNVGPNENNALTFDQKVKADDSLSFYKGRVKDSLDIITLICKELEELTFDWTIMHDGYWNFQSSFRVSKKIIGELWGYEKYLKSIGITPKMEGYSKGILDHYGKYLRGTVNKYNSYMEVQSDYWTEPAKNEFRRWAFNQKVYMEEISRRISTLEVRCLYSDQVAVAVVEEQLKDLEDWD